MSIDDLPIIEPLPIRPEELKKDKEIWQPKWQCFCCQDTGKVRSHLVRLVMPNYNSERDRFPICQNCNLGHDWIHLEGNYDNRLTPDICRKLDSYAREDWHKTVQLQFEVRRKQIELVTKEISQSHSLRKSDRTDNDNREVQQQKAEIEATSPQSWTAMRKAYLGGDDE
ncbi:MAG: hypothetical protein NHB32_25110 [Fischerella sp. CENA71]|nr:hypothetical protein [Fischerella sp. CENA71]